MQTRALRPSMALALIAFLVVFGGLLALVRGLQSGGGEPWQAARGGSKVRATEPVQELQQSSLKTARTGGPFLTPTPDAPHSLPVLRVEPDQYVVQPGDTLGQIATRYSVSLSQLIQENQIANPDLLSAGMKLTIPVPEPEGAGPAFKVIPDSELVYGPQAGSLDVAAFIQEQGGLLASYHEDMDGFPATGAEIVTRVAQDYSVGPRLLLALVEYQSGWVTQAAPDRVAPEYPAGNPDSRRAGLYRQLAWAANELNRGFYTWRVNGVAAWVLADSSVVPISPVINAGTAAVQHFFATLEGRPDWEKAVSADGLFATYTKLFGYPFDYAVEPLLPGDLAQPSLRLPFEDGADWAFTGGPHGGWADGSAWAALDFAPPGIALGCVESDAWVTAVADGLILRAGNGAVIEDLDEDGAEGTGWVILYMHIEGRDRVAPGTRVQAGDRIGHPSCEGGVSTGSHVHLARRYNGEWIPADQDVPFNLDGWQSTGDGSAYNGFLRRNGETVEAYAGRSTQNGIQR